MVERYDQEKKKYKFWINHLVWYKQKYFWKEVYASTQKNIIIGLKGEWNDTLHMQDFKERRELSFRTWDQLRCGRNHYLLQ